VTETNSASFDGAVILVTGGAGFVGSNLVRFLLAKTLVKTVVVVDNYLSSDPANLPVDSRLRVLVGSAADPRVIDRLPRNIDYAFHLACYHGNQSSIHDPLADHDHNSFPSLCLFDSLSKRKEIKKVVYSAAGCAVAVKTFKEPAATSEDAPVSLFHDSPYSISKLIGEMYGNYYFSHYGMPFVKARFQNVYGPGEILGAGEWRGTDDTIWRNVVPNFVWKCLKNEPLPIQNGGQSTRDFIYVADVVLGLVRCALKGTPGESYNLGSGKETSILDLAKLIVGLSSSSAQLVVDPKTRDWDKSGRRFADVSKSQRELDFIAETSLETGLQNTIRWTKENFERIERSISKHLSQSGP
jgi:UDP-glucose 4-epimerase